MGPKFKINCRLFLALEKRIRVKILIATTVFVSTDKIRIAFNLSEIYCSFHYNVVQGSFADPFLMIICDF